VPKQPKGAKNKRTLIREAEEAIGAGPVLDSLHLLEATMAHFYTRAINLKRSGGKAEVIDANLRDAAAIAEKIAPYRYPRLSAVKLAGDPNNPARFKDDATADELRAEIMQRIRILVSAGLIDLKALPVPDVGTANRPVLASINRASMANDFSLIVSFSATRANAFVSNSADVDQCQIWDRMNCWNFIGLARRITACCSRPCRSCLDWLMHRRNRATPLTARPIRRTQWENLSVSAVRRASAERSQRS
jgi:hypothetical protein